MTVIPDGPNVKYTTFKIHPDQTIIRECHNKRPEYVFIRDAVGGYIETVPEFTRLVLPKNEKKRVTVYCNEEGKLIGLPYNKLATQMWWRILSDRYQNRWRKDTLAGTIIIIAKGNVNFFPFNNI